MAKNNIKGLTVEIGGDTTKLGKALEDVNRKSSNLSSELGEINRLLKLDPGNADLLAQKQKVLADAVDNTAQKLQTLKTAEKQVQKQFERGEVSEDQVRALQREIIATTKKLEGYEKAARDTAKGLDQMDDSAKRAEESSSALSKVGGAVSKGLTVIGAAVAAAGAALIASAEASREYRREMGKLDAAFNANGHSAETATETYKTLQGVIGETDQSVEAAQQISLLAQSEEEAAKWADLAAGVVGQFGDALQPETFFEAANETLKLGEATGAYVQMLEGTGMSVDEFNAGLAACNTEAEKQAYMLQITEKQLGAAGERYKETNAEVIRANEANEEWAASMAEVGGAVEPLLTDIKLLGASLLSDLVPAIKEVTGAFRGMLNGDEGAAANLGEALSGVFSQLLTKITELLPSVAEMGVSLVTTLATSIVMALPQLVSTAAQVVVSLLNGLAAAIPQLVAAIQAMIPHLVQALVEGIPQIIQAGVNLLLALLQAIPLVIPPLVAAIPQIVMAVVNGLLAAIPQLIQGALQFLMAIVQAIPLLIQQLVPQIPVIVQTIINGLLENIPLLIDGALQLLDAIVQAIPLIIPPLVEALPQIINTLVTGLIQAVPQLVQGAIQLLNGIIQAIPVIIQALIPQIPKIVSTIVTELLRATPVLLKAAVELFMALVKAIPQVVGELIRNLPQIITAILGAFGELPKLIFGIGQDLVKGLWNGIKDMVGWVLDKIKGFGESILSGIKSFFGIKSPSRVFRDEVGKMLTEGMAEGIEANADKPLDAMAHLSQDLLDEADTMNGLAFERNVNHTFAASDPAAAAETGLMSKLDKILAAIERGQILMINGDTLVGATAGQMNNALGQRRVLAERGAI